MSELVERRRDPAIPASATSDRWRPLAPLDRGWTGVVFTRSFVHLDVPEHARIVTAMEHLARTRPEVGRWLRADGSHWRPVRDDEIDVWLRGAVVAIDDADQSPADLERISELNSAPLGELPLRLMVGPDWVSLTLSHVVGDAWSLNRLLGWVLTAARVDGPALPPVPWSVISSRRSDLLLVRRVLARPAAAWEAVRHRRELAGGTYEPAAVRADALPHATIHLASEPGASQRLRVLRDASFPGVSLSALVAVGLRVVLDDVLPAARPGFECIYNDRSEADGTAQAWGNFASGVYVRPDDDLAPAAVAAEIARVRRSGLSTLARLSLRLRGSRPVMQILRSRRRVVSMPRPEGRPRLTFSWMAAHLVDDAVPGLLPGRTLAGMHGRPNGVESISVHAIECAGRIHFGVGHVPAVWPTEVVRGAIERLAADPVAVLRAVAGPEAR